MRPQLIIRLDAFGTLPNRGADSTVDKAGNRGCRFWGAVLLCGLLLLYSSAVAAQPTPPSEATNSILKLDWVLTQVLSNNPALKSSKASAAAMEARIRQARAWEDPTVGVDLERTSTQFDDLNDAEWMVSQQIPISGKNLQRRKIATAEAAAALSEVHARQLELMARARTGFFRYANGHAQIAINSRSQFILQQLVGISRDKYALGKRSQADVLMAETELARLLEERRDFEREISDAQSQLNTLMFRPAYEPLPPPEPADYRDADLELPRLQALALQHRPEIEASRKRLDAAQAQVTLAKRAWLPDPEFRIEARQFNGGGGRFQEYDTGIFLKFPWFNQGKYRGAIAEARKQTESSEQALAAFQSETLAMVRDQLTKIETFHHHYEIFRERIEPLARQAIEASRIAYVADQVTIIELLTAQRNHREAESRMQHHLTQYLTALAELEPMIGRSAIGVSGSSATPLHSTP
jgi:outer membrane protein TolC